MYASNSTKICIYGTKLLTLGLGLKRRLQWPFIIPEINKPIIAADVLHHFGLLVYLRQRCLLDL